MIRKSIFLKMLVYFVLFINIETAWSSPDLFSLRINQAENTNQDTRKYDKTSMLEMFKALKNMMIKFDSDCEPVFTPEELQEIAKIGFDEGIPLNERFNMMLKELQTRYPGRVADELHWVFNSSGNVLGQLALVYASPTEYIAFFGTPVGATGFSGRYNEADVWDMMVQGEMLTYVPGQFEPDYYYPGDMAYLAKGSIKGFRYVGSTWMIDYSRGNIITMFPYGVIAPAMNNTLDFKSAWEQISDYAKLLFKSAL